MAPTGETGLDELMKLDALTHRYEGDTRTPVSETWPEDQSDQ